MNPTEIVLVVARLPQGGEFVLPSKARVARNVRLERARAAELEKTIKSMEAVLKSPNKGTDVEDLKRLVAERKGEHEAILQNVQNVQEYDAKLRELVDGKTEDLRIPFRPYTDGEKQDALAEATDYSRGTPMVNYSLLNRLLVSASTGIPLSEIRSLPPHRVDALIAEVVERTEPDPMRIDFLS